MKIAFIILIVIHGVIHILGFVKAFNLAAVAQLNNEISKPLGVAWSVAAALFVITALLIGLQREYWWMIAVIGVTLSQYLILTNWNDAKAGTFANTVILLVAIPGYAAFHFNQAYKNEVKKSVGSLLSDSVSLLTESDIDQLPDPVKKYIRLTGAIGKPKVKSFRIEFSGQIRKDEQSEWMPFSSQQYNFIDASTRLFFMNATMKHLPVSGFHAFKNGKAYMDIRMLSLFQVQYQSGKEMDIAETVTFFNDMCCMAPATLIDPRIKWLEFDDRKAKAVFENNGISISAWLYFNEKGELVNFVSDDRYAVSETNTLEKIRWSTPLKNYKSFDGNTLAGYADAIYSYPKRDLCYGNFKLTNIIYNPTN
jgi:hypothetical protein